MGTATVEWTLDQTTVSAPPPQYDLENGTIITECFGPVDYGFTVGCTFVAHDTHMDYSREVSASIQT